MNTKLKKQKTLNNCEVVCLCNSVSPSKAKTTPLDCSYESLFRNSRTKSFLRGETNQDLSKLRAVLLNLSFCPDLVLLSN